VRAGTIKVQLKSVALCRSFGNRGQGSWDIPQMSKPNYRCRHMISPPRMVKTRTGYKSRGLNGPPYFNTSFRHFFTVDSLLACSHASKLVHTAEHYENSHNRHKLLGHRLARGKETINDAIAPSKEVEENLRLLVNIQERRHESI
jgi:hypothetical protein